MMGSRSLVVAIGMIIILMSIAPAMAIKVTGISLVTDVSPGEHIIHKMNVDIGDANETMDVVAQLFGCGMALDGSRIQLSAEDDISPYSAIGFLSLNPERVTVSPGVESVIVLEGTVPQDIGDGGRYALVNIATVPKKDQLIGVSSAVEIPVFLTIEGTDIIETPMSPGRGLTRDGWKTTYRYPAHVKPDMGSEGR